MRSKCFKRNMETDIINLFTVTLISLSTHCYAELDFRHRCLLYMETCVDHCPRMMHPYNTRCDGDTLSQRTCNDPEIRVLGYTCGWSRCDCNGDLLLDEENGLCVPPMECSADLAPKYRRRPEEDPEPRMNARIKIPNEGIEDDRTNLDKK